jgi:hypothetical protein
MEKRLTRLLEQVYGEARVQFELSVIVGDDVVIPDVLVLASEHPAMHRDVLNEPRLQDIFAEWVGLNGLG